MTMIELVARAICGETPDRVGPFTCDDGRKVEAGKPAWTAWEREARVAIAVVSDEFSKLAYAALVRGGLSANDAAKEVSSMIEALKDQPNAD